MALFDVIGELYDPNADVKPRFLVNQGGTSSGKTYTIMQRLIVLSFEHPMAIITVCGQDLPNLKVGAMRDLDTILHTRAELLDWFKNNKSDSSYRGKNGSIIEFKSYKDAQDAKNGKRDYLFVNEANGVPYEVFWQLAIRTRKQVFIDYNPSARFWVHNNIIGRDDCRLILSDHRNNRFLTEQEHKKIEEIDDPELWRVYARGLTGKITGLIFTNWGIVDKLPPREEWKMECRGMDFGFTNDPTALEHVILAHGELWVDEEIYQPGMTNDDIADRCKEQGRTKRDLIIADSAEPKSIQEIHNRGLWIIGSTQQGDGVKYKGRGLIQITGRANYQKYANYCGFDVVESPELLERSLGATKSSMWVFDTFGCNELADKDDLKAIRRKINGGYNGLAACEKYLKRAKEALEIKVLAQ